MVELSGINKAFKEKTVLSDVSFSIDKNEFICIVGENGVGKTTLLNIISMLMKPDSGKISINGQSRFTAKEIRNLRKTFFGFIFQDNLLLPDKTVRENLQVSLYGKKDEAKITGVLKKLNLDSSCLDRKTYLLSGGEQKKVAIARMMLKPYELVLADEPTESLDKNTKKVIIDMFLKMKEDGKTIVCVTHDSELIKASDRVISLSGEENKGEI